MPGANAICLRPAEAQPAKMARSLTVSRTASQLITQFPQLTPANEMPTAMLRNTVWQALSRSVIAAVLLFAGSSLHAQEMLLSGNGAVAGRVFCADTQKPARFAGVRLTPASSANGMMGGSFAGAGSTSADGSFFINNVR